MSKTDHTYKLNKQCKNPVSLLSELLEWMLVFLLVVECNGAWFSSPAIKERWDMDNIWFVGILSVILLYTILNINKAKKVRLIVCVALLATYFAGFMHFNPYHIETLRKTVIVTLALSIFVYDARKENGTLSLFFKYEKLIAVIVIVSVFLWFVGSVLGMIPPTGQVEFAWGDYREINHYWYIYFEPQETVFLGIYSGIRNCAFFTEAPMASFHFCLGLMIEAFLKKKRSFFVCVLFSIGIITTMSTTGYALMLGVWAFIFIERFRKNLIIRISIPLVIGVAIIGVVILVSSRLKVHGTGDIRVDDYIVCFKAWMDNPIFGNGYGNNQAIVNYMGAWRSYNQGLSNTPMVVLAHCGIYIGILYLYSFIKYMVCQIKAKDWRKLTFAGLFLALIFVTVLPYQWLLIMILLYFANANCDRDYYYK